MCGLGLENHGLRTVCSRLHDHGWRTVAYGSFPEYGLLTMAGGLWQVNHAQSGSEGL